MIEKLSSYLWLSFGAILQGIAMTLFLFPHAIPSGGAAGVAILMEYHYSLGYEWTLWILNFTLLVLSLKWLGVSSFFRTIFTVTITSFTISILSPLVDNPFSYVWLDLIIGACIFGIGVGLLFCKGASSGGIAIIAHVVHRVFGVMPGKVLFVLNIVIFLGTAVTIGWMIFIYALVSQLIATRVIDLIYRSYITLQKSNNVFMKKEVV
ncbi:YitT family protein [Bacillus sp. FJAT-45350]|uniref:YitT family protein n=1 Tax=Bacillus sp. FJAT-45350 TaxID=2011014 RepID=UPI000BB71AD6|nr:YitT family protein [Bacillus sp. FJAT-45350]